MLKYIHFFGTSLTAGGGFEFNSKNADRRMMIYETYKHINESKTQFDFSYPGQFSKLILAHNIKVNNFAKNGYGNERIYRNAFNIINSHNFDKNQHLFIFEFSFLGRKELFFNHINDYITLNYSYKPENLSEEKYTNISNISTANSYWYDDDDIIKILNESTDFFKKYAKNLINLKNEYDNFYMQNKFFYYYLLQNKVNFLVLRNECGIEINDLHKIDFQSLNNKLKLPNKTDLYDLISQAKLTIRDETHGSINDLHFGYYGNKLISEILFNKLIDLSKISATKINIDWNFYEKIYLKKNNFFNLNKNKII